MSHTLNIACGGERYSVLHDGGWPLDGNVVVYLDAAHVFTPPQEPGGRTVIAVTIPFRVLADAVGAAVADRRIADLEQADSADLLGLREDVS